MRDGAYMTDGTKAIPLSALRPEAWTPMDDEEYAGPGLTPRRGQTRVPALYRAVDIRAKAVAGMPFRLERNGQDVTNDDEMRPFIKQLRSLLYLTESSLCCYNQAYWELGTNRLGLNLTPFWLATSSITPDIDPRDGLRGFFRTGGTGQYLKPRQVAYFWGPSTDIEIGPDRMLAPVAVVLSAARLLHYLDRFATGFFQRGAVKVTLLTVEGNPPKPEMEKLDAWWRRMVAGVRNAFGSAVVRAGVKPVVIGSSVQETSAPQLTKLSREDVAAGMGVPMSLLFSNALAGGTADAERLNFYDFTVVPECEHVIDGPLNERYLERIGLRLIWTPEKLEVYQKSELAKAQAIFQLVGQPLMTIDEGRERMELPPMAKVQPPQTPALGAPADQLAIPAPADGAATADPNAPAAEGGSTVLLPGTFDALRAADLEKWQRKALKALERRGRASVGFESPYIDPHELLLIGHELQHAETPDAVKAAFKVAPPGEDLTDEEQPLYERLKAAFSAHGEQVATAIMKAQPLEPILAAVSSSMTAALLPAITETVNDSILELSAQIGPHFDVPTLAQDVAGRYVSSFLSGMEKSTRQAVEKAVMTYRATPGMSRDDLIGVLRGGFGARRAELIAITATTEAASKAVDEYRTLLKGSGIEMEAVWQTVADERVCPICGPLNGLPQSEWGGRDIPGHIRCRCFKTLRAVKKPK